MNKPACPKHDTDGGPCYCPGSAYRPCISHHHACDCREHKVAVLVKAALDAAVQLDDTKHCVVGVSKSPDEDQRRQEKSSRIVERVYSACEALGVDIGAPEVAA